jgi:hypothetical protein
MSISKARAAMRAFLELDAEGRAHFDMLREDLAATLKHADNLPARHPEKASRRWKAVKHFMAQHDL